MGTDRLSDAIRGLRCTRMACNHLCGNYENCILNYTSLEEDPDMEKKIIECLTALVRLLCENVEPSKTLECRKVEATDKKPKQIGKLDQNQKCFERPVRFDFKPIKRRYVDPQTWKGIQDQRIDHGAHHIIDLIPSYLMPDLFEEEVKRTDVSAPLEASNVLEHFIKMANIRFEIRIDLSIRCNLCNGQHRLSRIPISAMFKTDQATFRKQGLEGCGHCLFVASEGWRFVADG